MAPPRGLALAACLAMLAAAVHAAPPTDLSVTFGQNVYVVNKLVGTPASLASTLTNSAGPMNYAPW